MRWLRFESGGRARIGYERGAQVQPVVAESLQEIIAGRGTADAGAPVPRGDVTVLAPLRPGKILCVGLNYMDHCREQKIEPPDRPTLFAKFPTSVTAPGAPIRWPADFSSQVDYEAELAVVIGREAKRVPEAEALSYVFGYTAANDVSARDVQFADGQWVRAKSLDTFCPLGSELVQVDDPQNLKLITRVNGEVMQDSNTSEMIFGVAELISFCSQSFTLEAGDVILTGTPWGCGEFMEPKRSLSHGDVVECEIEGIGVLRNPVISWQDAHGEPAPPRVAW